LPPLVRASLLLIRPLPLLSEVLVVTAAILCLAPTHALPALVLPLVVLELPAVAPLVLAYRVRAATPVRSLRVVLALRLPHLLILLLKLQLLLLQNKVGASVLIQVEIERLLAIEAFIGLWNGRPLVFDLVDLVKMLLQLFARVWGAIPARRLLDNRHDDFVLDHRVDINRVVHAAEDATLIQVANVQIIEKLQPERL